MTRPGLPSHRARDGLPCWLWATHHQPDEFQRGLTIPSIPLDTRHSPRRTIQHQPHITRPRRARLRLASSDVQTRKQIQGRLPDGDRYALSVRVSVRGGDEGQEVRADRRCEWSEGGRGVIEEGPCGGFYRELYVSSVRTGNLPRRCRGKPLALSRRKTSCRVQRNEYTRTIATQSRVVSPRDRSRSLVRPIASLPMMGCTLSRSNEGYWADAAIRARRRSKYGGKLGRGT